MSESTTHPSFHLLPTHIVVGAGTAGLLLTQQLLEAGHNVVLIGKMVIPELFVNLRAQLLKVLNSH